VKRAGINFEFTIVDDYSTILFPFKLSWDSMLISGTQVGDPAGEGVCYLALFSHG